MAKYTYEVDYLIYSPCFQDLEYDYDILLEEGLECALSATLSCASEHSKETKIVYKEGLIALKSRWEEIGY